MLRAIVRQQTILRLLQAVCSNITFIATTFHRTSTQKIQRPYNAEEIDIAAQL